MVFGGRKNINKIRVEFRWITKARTMKGRRQGRRFTREPATLHARQLFGASPEPGSDWRVPSPLNKK